MINGHITIILLIITLILSRDLHVKLKIIIKYPWSVSENRSHNYRIASCDTPSHAKVERMD